MNPARALRAILPAFGANFVLPLAFPPVVALLAHASHLSSLNGPVMVSPDPGERGQRRLGSSPTTYLCCPVCQRVSSCSVPAEMPSTSNGESSKQEAMQKTCKNSDIEK